MFDSHPREVTAVQLSQGSPELAHIHWIHGDDRYVLTITTCLTDSTSTLDVFYYDPCQKMPPKCIYLDLWERFGNEDSATSISVTRMRLQNHDPEGSAHVCLAILAAHNASFDPRLLAGTVFETLPLSEWIEEGLTQRDFNWDTCPRIIQRRRLKNTVIPTNKPITLSKKTHTKSWATIKREITIDKNVKEEDILRLINNPNASSLSATGDSNPREAAIMARLRETQNREVKMRTNLSDDVFPNGTQARCKVDSDQFASFVDATLIPIVVMHYCKDNNMYRVGTKEGHWLTPRENVEEIEVVPGHEIKTSDVPDKSLTDTAIVRLMSVRTNIQRKRTSCSCKNGICTGRCGCKRNQQKCNARCSCKLHNRICANT